MKLFTHIGLLYKEQKMTLRIRHDVIPGGERSKDGRGSKKIENCNVRCWRYNRDNQEKARKINAFGGLTQISIRIIHAERDQETSKAEERMASWLLYLTQS